jgi:hypothetical protein
MPYINEVFILGAKFFRFSRTYTPIVGTLRLLLGRFCEHPFPAVEMSGVLKLITLHPVQRLRTTGATLLIPPRAVMWYTGTVLRLYLRIRPLDLPRLRLGLEMLCSHKERERVLHVSSATRVDALWFQSQ